MNRIFIIATFLLLSGCVTTVEVIPGLCYNNIIGTTLCGPSIKPDDLPPQEPVNDLWQECEVWLSHPEPAWINCAAMAELESILEQGIVQNVR